MQASARLASSAASKRVIAGVGSTITRSCYRAFRGKAHVAPLSAQEPPPPKGQKRISKQERRVMIEKFVDKYRASNEGRFRSTTYVRQQIGGSHYIVRGILQELEYNHANPPMGNAEAAEFVKHSRSTNECKAGQAQETAHFSEHSWPKNDGKSPDNFEVLKNDQQDDVQHSLKDVTAGTATIEKAETGRSMSSVHIVETEATKPDFSISDSIKNADDRTLSDQIKSDSMMDVAVMGTEAAKPDFNVSDSIKNADEPALSDQTERERMKDLTAKSDLGKQKRGTEVNKLDLNKTGNSLNASESIVSDQIGSNKVIKGNMPHSKNGSASQPVFTVNIVSQGSWNLSQCFAEHRPKQEFEESTTTGLLGSLKSFASGIKNFWKSL